MIKKIYKITLSLFLLITVVSCTTPKTIEFGKKCTGDGKVYSYVWIKDKNSDANIKPTNCV
jgi:hypothetical protein